MKTETYVTQINGGDVEIIKVSDGWNYRRALMSRQGVVISWCAPVGPFPSADAAEKHAEELQ